MMNYHNYKAYAQLLLIDAEEELIQFQKYCVNCSFENIKKSIFEFKTVLQNNNIDTDMVYEHVQNLINSACKDIPSSNTANPSYYKREINYIAKLRKLKIEKLL